MGVGNPAQATTDAAQWFQSVRQYCNPVEVETRKSWQLAPQTPEGEMHKAACYALAGRIDRAPNHYMALYHAGAARFDLGDYEVAEGYLKRRALIRTGAARAAPLEARLGTLIRARARQRHRGAHESLHRLVRGCIPGVRACPAGELTPRLQAFVHAVAHLHGLPVRPTAILVVRHLKPPS